jgi:site-specific DNA-methyltransferase (adenine-specific)
VIPINIENQNMTAALYLGDCLESMACIPTGSVSTVFTSPPYNLRNSTGNGMRDGRGGKWSSAKLLQGYASHNDDMPHAEYVAWQRQVLSECMRCLDSEGAIFYNHKLRVQNGLMQDRADILSGFPVRQQIIWRRRGGINFNAGYFLPTYEVIYLIAKKGFKLTKGANSHGDVWDIQQEKDNDHPAPFPVSLSNRVVSSTQGGTVLDPFMGSGTTGVSCALAGRDFIGVEIDPDYFNGAKQRIKNAKPDNQTGLRPHQSSED